LLVGVLISGSSSVLLHFDIDLVGRPLKGVSNNLIFNMFALDKDELNDVTFIGGESGVLML